MKLTQTMKVSGPSRQCTADFASKRTLTAESTWWKHSVAGIRMLMVTPPNLLVRSSSQYSMKLVADRLLQYHLMHVSFGSHVDTWQGGVVYISVASEHKPEHGLDNEPGQWKKEGCLLYTSPSPRDRG